MSLLRGTIPRSNGVVRRRTIIYVGAFELPDRNTAAQRAHANALIFKQLGYRVVLIGISRTVPAAALVRRTVHDGFPFECWETPRPTNTWMWLRRIASIGAVAHVVKAQPAEDLAAIVCYDYPAIAQARLKTFCHRRGALALAEATEWYGVNPMRNLAGIIKNIDRPLRMRWANPQMDGVIAASRFLSDYYRRSGVPTVELPTVPPDEPVNASARDATPDGEPKSLIFAATGFDPVSIAESRDGPKDRLDKVIVALHVAQQLGADFRLHVFGVERAGYLAIVPEHSQVLADLGRRVEFYGWQPRKLLQAKMAAADYSIFLRRKTIASLAGSPTKFAESVHLGTPVITNAVGSLTSYHVEGSTGHYIDYEDIELAGTQLRDILKRSAAEISRLKRYCYQSGLFDYRRYLPRMKEFMDEVERVSPRSFAQ